MRQIVRAEAEKLRVLRDLVRDQRGARNFDHRADQIIEFRLLFLRYLRGDAMDDLDLELQFPRETDERNHDFRLHLDAFLLHLGGRFKNSARLHLGDLRIK